MPYPYTAKLLLWPTACLTVDVSTHLEVQTGEDENCFLLLTSGRAEITHEETVFPFNMKGMAVFGRNITATVVSKSEHPCQMMILRMKRVTDPPCVDLNHLCLTVPLIDAFYSYKPRFCILEDHEDIRLSFIAVSSEMSRHAPEWQNMIAVRLEEMLIQLARSFYTHSRLAGTQLISAARDFIRTHYQEELTVDRIAAHVGISRSYLAQLFSEHLGYSTVDYIHAVRCDHAAYLLRTTRFTILDIALEVGFNSRQHFTRTFIKMYEMTPAQYRKAQRTEAGIPGTSGLRS